MKRLSHFQKTERIPHPSRRNAILEGLIVFTRYPEPGKTKTRLIPSLGSEGAADLHRRMTEHTVACLRQLKKSRPMFIEIHHEGGDKSLMRQWLGSDLFFRPQGAGDLGERMARAFHGAFECDAARVVLVGTDCPGLTERLLGDAFESLRHTDLVLGPARDGGYYLIGLRKTIPELFGGMPWGTEKVLDKTQEVADGLGLSVRLLDLLDDVDRPEDLAIWRKASKGGPASSPPPCISLIIPTLNESENIAETLASIHASSNVEVIVVDGESTDETAEIARSCGAKVVTVSPGRAGQMNAGAAIAEGETLLFLHSDTRLPRGFDHYVRRTLAEPGTLAGAFELRIDGNLAGLRFIERTANWRSRLFGLPYGDQAIFLQAGLFRYLGGFAEIPIMEDFELMRRLRKVGRIVIVPVPVLTSARRWKKIGIWQTTMINYAIPVAYSMGVSPSRLARWYHRRRKKIS
jgi:rSAM/selenodomain-associated transferase 2/rSAM/selenodomain-associated transferase 1